ncbi:hypothetical protein vseg_013464 [Gypsophila vaccaria]
MKVPPKSDGIITTFYLISVQQGEGHDEVDFEILGDQTLQTNIFVNGIGNREQRFRFWFDPTLDFHTYHILWNSYSIIFFVDNTPIRVFKNNKMVGIPFLERAMHIEATLWTADWAGAPVQWSYGPFKAQYKNFGIDGCPSSDGPVQCESPGLKWSKYHGLNDSEIGAYKQIKKQFLTYDYCTDPQRQPAIPKECEDF